MVCDMPIITRSEMRLAAVALAVLLSIVQFRLFDCNEMTALSFAAGALTLLLIYATGEAMYNIATSPRPARGKLLTGAGVALAGAALVATVGFFTLLTHLCP